MYTLDGVKRSLVVPVNSPLALTSSMISAVLARAIAGAIPARIRARTSGVWKAIRTRKTISAVPRTLVMDIMKRDLPIRPM